MDYFPESTLSGITGFPGEIWGFKLQLPHDPVEQVPQAEAAVFFRPKILKNPRLL
jgi:hypothetical protein